ncbi:FecR family protein [Allomuricauda sp. XS_ASV26]|uniref:FecR family protein n=1 Tax=Allomuricauda sp. XS_ASV26 TaxID=3241292 RepID=UPI00351215D0
MRREKIEEACARYLAGEGNREERFLFELELSLNDEVKKIYTTYKEIWDNYPVDYKDHESAELQLNKAKKRFSIANIGAKRISLAIAASIVVGLFIIGGSLFKNPVKTFKTGAGERLTLQLPDSSTVILNEDSQISYSKNFSENRLVNLYGEAYFDIVHKKESPFKVLTSNIQVKVLGTQFNVNTKEHLKTVSLETGRVEVLIPENGMNLTLMPSEQIIYSPSTKNIDKTRFNVDEILAWKQETLQLKGESIARLLPKINNYYGVKFTCPDTVIAKKALAGTFKGKRINEFIESIEFITGFEIDKVGNREYLIKRNEN